MVELLGFFLMLAALALIVGTLAQGTLRLIGFVVLVFVGVIASGPLLQRMPISSFFNAVPRQTQSERATQAPANLPSSPVRAAPAYGGGEEPEDTTRKDTTTSSPTSSSNRSRSSTNRGTSNSRGIRGGW